MVRIPRGITGPPRPLLPAEMALVIRPVIAATVGSKSARLPAKCRARPSDKPRDIPRPRPPNRIPEVPFAPSRPPSIHLGRRWPGLFVAGEWAVPTGRPWAHPRGRTVRAVSTADLDRASAPTIATLRQRRNSHARPSTASAPRSRPPTRPGAICCEARNAAWRRAQWLAIADRCPGVVSYGKRSLTGTTVHLAVANLVQRTSTAAPNASGMLRGIRRSDVNDKARSSR